MATKSFLECERKSIDKMKKFQLPYSFKKIGVTVLVVSILSIFANNFTANIPGFSIFAKYGMLIGLLVISISKDKVEDEFIRELRMQSFKFAFIMGVLISIAQPFINYFVDFLFTAQEPTFQPNSDFMILSILLIMQIFYFIHIKRMYQ